MDVHRSRFVPYPTSPITALAFSRTNDSGHHPSEPVRLALGRLNGSIELWNALKGNWVQEVAFAGANASIDALQWTQEPDEKDADGKTIMGQYRLFSIAASPAVIEWNLATGQIARTSTGNFSEVWCFAAQPRLKQQPQQGMEEAPPQDIVAGCADGTLVQLSTADNDLQFTRFLARVSGKKSGCMSIAYQNRNTVIAGYQDSMIRVYDTRNGSLLRNMSLGAGLPGAPKNIHVWSVKALPNGDIVSADSNGEVRFWDGRHYSMLQRVVGFDTEMLDLAVSNDGKTVFAAGMNGKMARFRQANHQGGRPSWAKLSHRKIHTGEAKAIAAFDSKGMSVVVSGGDDVAPVVTPLRNYGQDQIRHLPRLPHISPVTSAPNARLLVSWWEHSISIWRIADLGECDLPEVEQKPRELIAKIVLDTIETVASVAISGDGTTLAACTNEEVRVFQLRRRPDSGSLAVRKLAVPDDLRSDGARLLAFSPNGKWLAAVTPDSEVRIARLQSSAARPKHLEVLGKAIELDRRHHKAPYQTGFKHYDRTISRLAFADDSSVLVASDLSGCLDSWVLEGHEDLTAPAIDTTTHDANSRSSGGDSDQDSSSDSSDDEDEENVIFYGQHWADNPSGHLLPKLDSAPLVLSFRPNHSTQFALENGVTNGNPGVHATRHNPHAHSHELPQGSHRLFALTGQHHVYEFDILLGRLTEWSRRNPTAALPERFTALQDRAMGAIWDVSGARDRVWLYGSSWLCALDVSSDFGESSSAATLKKRKADDHIEGGKGKKRKDSMTNGTGDKEVLPDGVGAEEDETEQRGLALVRSERKDSEGGLVPAAKSLEERCSTVFKYRPILGIVPMASRNDEKGPVEVVLVERPSEIEHGRS
ncbi:hypothetical protein MBLNU230_g2511t1 [Neophaeotheca triangularis]